MASGEQGLGVVGQKYWSYLLEMVGHCEELFTKIKQDVDAEKVLPSVALGIIQQQLYPGKQHVTIPRVLGTRLKQIKERQLKVLVAGEVSAGKSTFLNILMGGHYLPVRWGETTKVVCEIRHHPTLRRATIEYKDPMEESVILDLPEHYNAEEWQDVRECIQKKTYKSRMVDKVIIDFPSAIVEDIFKKDPLPDPTNTPTEQVSQGFDQEFVEQMKKPYAKSFEGQEARPDYHDIDQSVPKQVYVAEDNVATSDGSQTNLKMPVTSNDGSRSLVAQGNANFALSIESNDSGMDIVYSRDSYTSATSYSQEETRSNGLQTEGIRAAEQAQSADSAREETDIKTGDSFQVTFLDFPGIKDDTKEDRFEPVLATAPSCRAFIFFIDPCVADAVGEKRLQSLMEKIEAALQSEEIELNPDCSLFVINKTDTPSKDELDDLKQDILNKLREKWPLINKDHVISLEAKTVLAEMSEGNMSARDKLYELIGKFLQSSARITMEEHCLWMLNFLQTAYAFVTAGKRWAGLKESKKKMNDSLRQTYTETIDLYRVISAQEEEDIKIRALKGLHQIISESAASLTNITRRETNIAMEKIRDDIAWIDISKQIDGMILDKLNETKEAELRKLKLQYNKDMCNRLRKKGNELKRLEDTLHGIVPKAADNDPTQGFDSLILPVALGGVVRVAPMVNPLMLLAVPLLPVPLLVAFVADEIQYHSDEAKREEFKKDKFEFLRKRIRNICERTKTIRQDSEMFSKIFGESKRKDLLSRVNTLLERIKLLLESSVQDLQRHKNTCCKHIIETVQIYSKYVMKHTVHPSEIKWTVVADLVRKKIGGGGQANVFEATLKGCQVAVKEFHCTNTAVINDDTLSYLLQAHREYFTLRQLSRKPSENLVKFIGTSLCTDDDDALKFRIVMEKCLGNLNMLIQPTMLDEDAERALFMHHATECAAGISFLHDNNVVHRDIKPENFLLREELSEGMYRVVVCDMGCSKLTYQICSAANCLGTYAYYAPELRQRPLGVHTKASDVYSLGLVLWELASRRHIAERSPGRMLAKSREMPRDERTRTVLEWCLGTNPASRKPVSVILEKCRNQD